MNVQPGKRPLPAAGSTAARAALLPQASGLRKTSALAPPTQKQAAAPAHAPLSSEAVKQVARQINDFLKSSSSSIEFTVDGDSSTVVVRVVDSQTNELIRQIPSEEMIAISKSLDQMAGLLLKQTA